MLMEGYQDHSGNGLRRIYEQFEELKRVLHKNTHPKHTSIYYNRIQLSVLCCYPNKKQCSSAYLRAWHAIALLNGQFFFITLLIWLPNSDNVVDLGQDTLWTISCFYMLFKWTFLYFRADKVDEIIDALDQCHCEPKSEPVKTKIRATQRLYFIVESVCCMGFQVFIILFLILVCLQPAWTSLDLPFRALYPFHWHDPSKHSIAHMIIYMYQCINVSYYLFSIMCAELSSMHCFSQLALNLKILRLELNSFAKLCKDDEQLFKSELGRLVIFHQRIIGLVDRTNEVFYAPFVMQMIASYLMLSLATFELLVDLQPSQVVRFSILFFHFSYWCYVGDMVTHESTQVAHAAYDVYEWSPKSPVIKRDIMFMLQRSQEPLLMAASPFPPFNLISYMGVLKQCYSILTILMETMD